ncbi:ABC transporter permease [Paenibacillus thermoaerophilus]|uniref:ABC transporter permease n=1 Tax=Paenibacillus thermoaerophilus TaxID=1215385 RepID=A0ABW2V159_9BACL|nr:ABC transporter permease [Paenibacillus thermoaerophilus]
MLYELFAMAFKTVVGKPMRTLLTMLGVIIGVGSVVTLVSIGNGTTAQIEAQYDSLGTNLLVVNLMGSGRATQLDYDELMELEGLPEIGRLAPTINKSGATVKYDRTSETATVIGTNDRYLDVMKAEIDKGRFLAPADNEFRNPVAVLGSEIAKTYFGTLDPVGESIRIDGVVYEVIGVLKPKGSNIAGSSVDQAIIAPLESVRRVFKLGNIRTTYIEAETKEAIPVAEETIKQYLTYKFKSSNGFQVMNQEELIESRTAAVHSLTRQLISVAAISLVVGGIGIMNIMLVTVTERTKEIGLRKSIGAKRRHILAQFLIESSVLSGLGGVVGLLVGIAASLLWPVINPNQPTELSLQVGLYALAFSVLVGIVFGLYPANKASRLKPIDALRFD